MAFTQFISGKNKMKINTNLAVLFTRILQISLNSMNLIFAILPMAKQSCTVCSTTTRRRYATKPGLEYTFFENVLKLLSPFEGLNSDYA